MEWSRLGSKRGSSCSASLPSRFERAKTILRELESEAGKPPAPMQEEADQVSLSSLAETEVLSRLRREQVDTLSPLEALNLLYELKQKLQ